jgi:hypothetical protein
MFNEKIRNCFGTTTDRGDIFEETDEARAQMNMNTINC